MIHSENLSYNVLIYYCFVYHEMVLVDGKQKYLHVLHDLKKVQPFVVKNSHKHDLDT